MTDIPATTPVSFRRFSLPKFSVSWRATAASIAAIPAAIGDAFNMVYVDPYGAPSRRVIPDEDLDGRDPDW